MLQQHDQARADIELLDQDYHGEDEKDDVALELKRGEEGSVALAPITDLNARASGCDDLWRELTHLVGALGFHDAVAALSTYTLVCVDEFELDDPGDTVLVSTLLTRLREAGVRLAATSNTLPGKLGEGRFATDDFLREIQGLSAHFESVRIDGEDYRHRGLPEAPDAPDLDAVRRVAEEEGATYDHFVDLSRHLAQVHPSKYGALLDGVRVVCLEDVRTVDDQAVALRLVVLADRMYDRDLPVVASGVTFDALFAPPLLEGGYRKKYFRAVSRLVALAREGDTLVSR